MKKYFSLMTSAFLISFMLLTAAKAEGDPVSFLEATADQMISQLKANKANIKTNPNLVYSLAYKVVVPRADLDEMSKRVLPPETWNSATASQRSEFKKEFTSTLVRTYASALAEYNDQTIKFYPVRGGYQGRSSISVNSDIVRSDGPSISVVYQLIQKGSGWKLYDMTVEGVSMLQSFRSQFADQLNKGDMASLINVLKQHNGQ